jgi:hypothetical protein
MGEMSHIYDAIEEFKKFSTPEQRKSAAKFHSWYNGPNKSYINDEDNFEITDLDGLDDFVEFLQGDDPFYMSDPPEDIQQEVMQQFNDYLFEEYPQLQALKKGYDKPVAILSAEDVVKVLRSISHYRSFLITLKEEILPEIEKIVKIDFDDEIVGFSSLNRAIKEAEAALDSAATEIKLYFGATMDIKYSSEQEGASVKQLSGMKRAVLSHFEQYGREMYQIQQHNLFINKYLSDFKQRLPKKVSKMISDGSFQKNNMKSFADAVMSTRDSLIEYLPIYGSIRMYDFGQPIGSVNNAAALGGVAVDVAMLVAAIKTASAVAATPLHKFGMAILVYAVSETFLGAAVSNGLNWWIKEWGDMYWPEHSRLDSLEKRGFGK